MPTAAVVGSSGFLGRYLIDHLRSAGHDVRCFDSDTTSPWVEPGTRYCDITDPRTLEGIFDGCDVVYGLAAIVAPGGDPDLKRRVNVDGAVNVLEAASQSGALTIHVSSVGALGRTADSAETSDETLKEPTVSYEATKQEALVAMRELSSKHRVRIVMPPSMFGPVCNTDYSFSNLMAAYATRRIPYAGPATSFYSVAAATDVAEAMILVAERGTDGQTYILSDTVVSAADLLSTTAEIAGYRRPRTYGRRAVAAGRFLVRTASRFTKDPQKMTESWDLFTRSYAYSGDRMKQLGWTPPPLKQRITEFVEAARANTEDR